MGIVPRYSMTSVAFAVTLIDPLMTSTVMQFWLKGATTETVTKSCGTAAVSNLGCNVLESRTCRLTVPPVTPSCDNKLLQRLVTSVVAAAALLVVVGRVAVLAPS